MKRKWSCKYKDGPRILIWERSHRVGDSKDDLEIQKMSIWQFFREEKIMWAIARTKSLACFKEVKTDLVVWKYWRDRRLSFKRYGWKLGRSQILKWFRSHVEKFENVKNIGIFSKFKIVYSLPKHLLFNVNAGHSHMA